MPDLERYFLKLDQATPIIQENGISRNHKPKVFLICALSQGLLMGDRSIPSWLAALAKPLLGEIGFLQG